MKRKLFKIFFSLTLLIGIFILLNLPVTTRQGTNYQWYSIKIPLYLKVLDFFDRNYNYAQLAKRIIKGARTEEEKVLKVFTWTHENIRKIPPGFPIVDDHVWNIIIRGYGAYDQSADVFTTLCNYIGVNAFFALVSPLQGEGRIPLSLVKLNGKWTVFDSHYGVYFKDKNGDFADIEALKSNSWTIEQIDKSRKEPLINYANYFLHLPTPEDIRFSRANTQSPFNRLLYEIKKIGKRLKQKGCLPIGEILKQGLI